MCWGIGDEITHITLCKKPTSRSSSPCIEFKNLRVLNTWGGCLQRNFLRRFGAQLIQLKLVHVEQLTLHGSIREIFYSCPSLESLELQNCSIQDQPSNHYDHHSLQCRLVWWQLWNFKVWQIKFNRFLHPNKHPSMIFWYLMRPFDYVLSKNDYL